MSFKELSNQIKKSREDILAELHSSREKNNVIGILTRDTNELLTTAVTGIEEREGGDHLILLRDRDLHGYPLLRKKINLSNIERIIHFNIDYDDPQYEKVRRKEKFKV